MVEGVARAGPGFSSWKIGTLLRHLLIVRAITIAIGVCSWWVIVDFPSDATFLTPEERELVTRRLEGDGQRGARDEKWHWAPLRESFTDWKTWTGAVMYMGVDGALYAFSLFLPTIIKNMGTFSTTKAQLLSVPPYAFACFLVCILWIITYIPDGDRWLLCG